MPITMLAFVVGVLGMCGLPPACGFISKWFLGLGTIEAGSLFFLAVLLISSLLDVVYFFPIIYTAYFGRWERGVSNLSGGRKIKEAPLSIVIPLSITALFSIIFCFPNPITNAVLDLVRIAVNH
jgi:formate hydrogenlyase subunit 3/multisubunit Na+/H+ antiporter MnhD subunit